MKNVGIALVILVTASVAISALAQTNDVVTVAAKQTDVIPQTGVLYRLAPGQLYKTSETGPKEQTTSQAWAQANEFVFRTALRDTCVLPASKAIQHKIGVMVVFQVRPTGKKRVSVFVRNDGETIEYKD